MNAFYFGVWPGKGGHFLYDVNGRRYAMPPKEFPCTATPDGVFLSKPETLYKPHVWKTKGWTIYAMWDRSGDRRPGSNSVFLFKADIFDCWEQVCRSFPVIAERISDARMTQAPDVTT